MSGDSTPEIRNLNVEVPDVLIEDLAFPEVPRWHDDRLWFSDMQAETVFCYDTAIRDLQEVVTVGGGPGGLGWTPDGRLMVVSMMTRQVLCETAAGTRELEVFADLSEVEPVQCNDMLVGPAGYAYVGGFGFDLFADPEPRPTALVLIRPDGSFIVAADGLMFPNGMALIGEHTLVIAETYARQLTAFDVSGTDGSLFNRRVWATLPNEVVPDGICADGAGNLWAASPATYEALLIGEGGVILERRSTGSRRALACVLGDDDHTLYLTTVASSDPRRGRTLRSGRIEAIRVG